MPKQVSPYKTSIDKDNAYWMARLAKAVYTSKDDNSPDDEAILKELKAEDPKFQNCRRVFLIIAPKQHLLNTKTTYA